MVKDILKKVDEVNANGPFAPTWDSLRQFKTPTWLMNDKFGIFIHWGLYAIPAFGSEWYPRLMYQQGSPEYEHHIATYGPHAQFGYKDFIPQFTAPNFDAKEWIDLFKASGARYVVPVAEHHDGFQMYKSDLSLFNAYEMGPCRDVLGELHGEMDKQGLTRGLSSHRIEHWWFLSGGRDFPSDILDPEFADFYGPCGPSPKDNDDKIYEGGITEEFMDDWLARCVELVDNYRPKMLYFDWWIKVNPMREHLKRFVAYYYNRGAQWGEEVAVVYKVQGLEPDMAVFDVERGQLADTRYPFWQSDTALARNSWGYTENQSWKDADEVIGDLCDIVSKNGALLMNVGPKPDGTIHEEDRRLLLAIGDWLKVNGEAIYGTSPFAVYGEGPTKIVEGGFTDKEKRGYTPKDIRFTTKGGTLYAIALGAAEDGVTVIETLAKGAFHAFDIKKVSLLTGEDLPFTQDGNALRITVKANGPFAMKIE